MPDVVCAFNGLGMAVRYQLCMWWCRYISSNNTGLYCKQLELAQKENRMPLIRWNTAAFERAKANKVVDKELEIEKSQVSVYSVFCRLFGQDKARRKYLEYVAHMRRHVLSYDLVMRFPYYENVNSDWSQTIKNYFVCENNKSSANVCFSFWSLC